MSETSQVIVKSVVTFYTNILTLLLNEGVKLAIATEVAATFVQDTVELAANKELVLSLIDPEVGIANPNFITPALRKSMILHANILAGDVNERELATMMVAMVSEWDAKTNEVKQ